MLFIKELIAVGANNKPAMPNLIALYRDASSVGEESYITLITGKFVAQLTLYLK